MNKLLVVSGGSRGIGRAIVLKFAEEGFDIITCSRSGSSLRKLKKEVNAKNPKSQCLVFETDLSEKAGVKSFVDFIMSTKREVDVLVNNTGTFIPGLLHEEEDEVLEKLINTNLYSAYYLSRGIIPGMIAKKSGYIFNICSIASKMAYPNGGSYSVSKYALYAMGQVFREELKMYDIKVTSVLPGAVRTESWDGTDLPDERFIMPGEVADAIFSAFQLSRNSVIEELTIRPQYGDI